MQESFLQYIWQFQYFNKRNLFTVQGEEIFVYHPGLLNTLSGPDFSNARVKIGGMSWAGTIEIHTQSSEWIVHRHHHDSAYDNVVLHVVWKDDRPVTREDGTLLPTLELKGRVDSALILQYRKLVGSALSIPCERMLSRVQTIVQIGMMGRALYERLERKSQSVIDLLNHNKDDWEETMYQLLARNFGFKINSEPFLQLARGVPYRNLGRHADRLLQVEAILFGQAGFLEQRSSDPYQLELRREYKVMSAKYKLQGAQLKMTQWKFMRMRPANFPTIRLAQFSALISKQKNLFSRVLAATTYRETVAIFDNEQSEYWQTHYSFGSTTKGETCTLGQSSIDNLIINTVVPLLVAYGKQRDQQELVDRAEVILEQIAAEENSILRAFTKAGFDVKNAFDSQALIQLFNSYCSPRQCLNCAIGAALLKPDV
jgi:hypothetical protein